MEMEIKSIKEGNLGNSIPFVQGIESNEAKTDYTINEDAEPSPPSQTLYLRTQLLAAVAVSMGSLIVGFSLGYNTALINIKDSTMGITTEQLTLVMNLILLAAVVGAMAAAPLIEYFGRKLTMMGSAVLFFIGWIIIALAPNVYVLMAGRIVCGICIGVISLVVPIYLGESIQPKVRGAIGLLPKAFFDSGIILASFIGIYLDWSILAFLGAALSVPFYLLMILSPETSRWYVAKGRTQDACKALQWLRGENVNIEKEMQDITQTQAESDKIRGSACGQLFNMEYIPAVLISLGLMLFQQLSGIYIVMMASWQFLYSLTYDYDISSYQNLPNIIIGITNLVSTLIAIALIDRLGRKTLLYISSVTMIITLVIMSCIMYMRESANVDVRAYEWRALGCLLIYLLGNSIGFGPISTLMLGEILPSKIRGTAASLVTASNWICTYHLATSSGNLIKTFNMYGALWLFALLCLVGLLFVIFFVPETRGKSLDEIEKAYKLNVN